MAPINTIGPTIFNQSFGPGVVPGGGCDMASSSCMVSTGIAFNFRAAQSRRGKSFGKPNVGATVSRPANHASSPTEGKPLSLECGDWSFALPTIPRGEIGRAHG